MTSSLVGSEMCIRDSSNIVWVSSRLNTRRYLRCQKDILSSVMMAVKRICLLYTSDAADDM
eukprot:5918384-Prorocentrum_lima.AAC.1